MHDKLTFMIAAHGYGFLCVGEEIPRRRAPRSRPRCVIYMLSSSSASEQSAPLPCHPTTTFAGDISAPKGVIEERDMFLRSWCF